MKQKTLKALLAGMSLAVLFLSTTNMHARNENALSGTENEVSFELIGRWLFEKAEYMERPAPLADYQAKYTIEHQENLYAFSHCYQEAVIQMDVLNEALVNIICLQNSFSGTYLFPDNPPVSYGKQVRLTCENSGREREEHSAVDFATDEQDDTANEWNGTPHPMLQIEYRIEFIDAHTIGILLERPCWENGATKTGAIRCILKRDLEPNTH